MAISYSLPLVSCPFLEPLDLCGALVAAPTRKTGQPPTAATHRFYLNLAQTLFRWAVRTGYIRESAESISSDISVLAEELIATQPISDV